MKTKKLLTLSASVAAGTSASADIQYTELDQPLTAREGGNSINFHLSEGWAEYDNEPEEQIGVFQLSFSGIEENKPRIRPGIAENGVLKTGSETRFAVKLTAGDWISNERTYQTLGSIYLNNNTVNSTWPAGEEPGYLGLRLEENETFYYGWAKVEYRADEDLILYSFAYQDDGSPIQAGQIPEPKTAAFLTALAAGSAVLYRRRRKTLVRC